jgi:hypothetical protein
MEAGTGWGCRIGVDLADRGTRSGVGTASRGGGGDSGRARVGPGWWVGGWLGGELIGSPTQFIIWAQVRSGWALGLPGRREKKETWGISVSSPPRCSFGSFGRVEAGGP